MGKGSHTHSGKGLTQTVGKGSHTQWERDHTHSGKGAHTHRVGKGLTHTVGKAHRQPKKHWTDCAQKPAAPCQKHRTAGKENGPTSCKMRRVGQTTCLYIYWTGHICTIILYIRTFTVYTYFQLYCTYVLSIIESLRTFNYTVQKYFRCKNPETTPYTMYRKRELANHIIQ